jgi:hypothetical protein
MTLMCGDRWLETGNPFVEVDMSESQVEWLKAENQRLSKQVESLMSDTHRLDSARQAAVNQSRVLAEEVNRLTDENMALMAALSEVSGD